MRVIVFTHPEDPYSVNELLIAQQDYMEQFANLIIAAPFPSPPIIQRLVMEWFPQFDQLEAAHIATDIQHKIEHTQRLQQQVAKLQFN